VCKNEFHKRISFPVLPAVMEVFEDENLLFTSCSIALIGLYVNFKQA